MSICSGREPGARLVNVAVVRSALSCDSKVDCKSLQHVARNINLDKAAQRADCRYNIQEKSRIEKSRSAIGRGRRVQLFAMGSQELSGLTVLGVALGWFAPEGRAIFINWAPSIKYKDMVQRSSILEVGR
jgi:hypothetical protein